MFKACTVPSYFCLKRRVFETERKDNTGSFWFHYKQVVLYLHFLPFTGFFVLSSLCLILCFSFTVVLRFFPCHSRNTLFLLRYTTTLFYARLLYAFCFNASYQFTRFLNLCFLFLGLTPFGWFICIYVSFVFHAGVSILMYAYFFRAN
jgi:hypothetical protein